MLTVGEHDELWRKGAKGIIRSEQHLENIHIDLKRMTILECLKELYSLGEISKEEYVDQMKSVVNSMDGTNIK